MDFSRWVFSVQSAEKVKVAFDLWQMDWWQP